MFLPTTGVEAEASGIDQFDVILITGDTYLDSPYVGVAIIGNVLRKKGFKVGIIAQPDLKDGSDISRLGEPRLFWGVTAGSFDSMVANYTALKKKIKNDDMTPGGINNKRPDRAVIKYCNLIRRYFKGTRPIIIGGIEASLRRIVHYDFWSDRLRKSILFNSKADVLVYGMGERAVLQLAENLNEKKPFTGIKGICYASREIPENYIKLPSFEDLQKNNGHYLEMFQLFYENNHPSSAKGLYQKHDDRFLIQNPPQPYLKGPELDEIYEMGYERDVHPHYKKNGVVRAMDTIRFSINSHRGCFGECNFCAISVHQGREVRSRSSKSLEKEISRIKRDPAFKGIIKDIGGPTANMYQMTCEVMDKKGPCKKKRCLYPRVCQNLKTDHNLQIKNLKKLRSINGIRKIFISSGLRYDLILSDKRNGLSYLKEVIASHTSGQLKIAPEHTNEGVLKQMGKPANDNLRQFVRIFYQMTREINKKQFLTYYLIAAYPGCTVQHMNEMKRFFQAYIKTIPKQIQIFTPTPSTYGTTAYFLKKDPLEGGVIPVEKNQRGRELQKQIMFKKSDQ